MNIDLNLILPEIFLSLSIMSLLMIGVFKKKSSNLIFNLSILTLFILAALILNLSSVNKILIFNGEKLKSMYLFPKINILAWPTLIIRLLLPLPIFYQLNIRLGRVPALAFRRPKGRFFAPPIF